MVLLDCLLTAQQQNSLLIKSLVASLGPPGASWEPAGALNSVIRLLFNSLITELSVNKRPGGLSGASLGLLVARRST